MSAIKHRNVVWRDGRPRFLLPPFAGQQGQPFRQRAVRPLSGKLLRTLIQRRGGSSRPGGSERCRQRVRVRMARRGVKHLQRMNLPPGEQEIALGGAQGFFRCGVEDD